MQSNIVEELNESARRLIWLFNLENESGSIQTIREAAAEITALRDRVARLEGERQWRPIESAPRDGTAILAILTDSDLHHVIRCLDGQWLIAWDGFDLTSNSDRPTHWMPLPDSPPATDGV